MFMCPYLIIKFTIGQFLYYVLIMSVTSSQSTTQLELQCSKEKQISETNNEAFSLKAISTWLYNINCAKTNILTEIIINHNIIANICD